MPFGSVRDVTALNRTVAFGTDEDDEYPADALNDNGEATGDDEAPEDDE